MPRSILLAALCIVAAIPSTTGTATLVPRLSSAGCVGHFEDLSVISVTCASSNGSSTDCTYGSEVFVTGQVTANADVPRPMAVSVTNTPASIYRVGIPVYSTTVEDVCESGSFNAYPDTDDSQTCPGQGVYNFQFHYTNHGTRQSWFAGWSGFTMGMAVHIKHEGGGSDYATCYMNVHASRGSDDSYATNATAVAIAGLASACIGVFARKRKQRLSSDEESEERTREMATNFELVEDPNSSVV